MSNGHLERGAAAGVAGGLVNGLFVAFVGNNFVAGLEHFEHGHDGGAPAVSSLTTAAVSVGSGALLGLLAGVCVFGIGFYFLEPALPDGVVGRLVLAAAAFLTISGAPWLVLPPQPPGVEQSLAVGTRLTWYALMMGAGGVVSVLCLTAARRFSGSHPLVRTGAAFAPLALLAIPVVIAPTNSVHGDVPPALVAAFRWTVVFGQAALWATIAATHARLGNRGSTTVDEPTGVPHAD